MTTSSALSRPALFTPDELGVPPRRWEWTRLGHTLRYTDTEPKRAAILTAVGGAAWRDPSEHADLLRAAPVSQVIGYLLDGQQLIRAAVVPLPWASGAARQLIGLHCAAGDRYWLLQHRSYVTAVLHDTPENPADLTANGGAAGCPVPDDRVVVAAGRLFDAECALHVARQSHVDAWIAAASNRLHHAVFEHDQALAARDDGAER
jgi:hypothetical protein